MTLETIATPSQEFIPAVHNDTRRSTQLMYGPDDNLITAAQLSAIPTPPAMGRWHQPIGFGDYLELVKHRLNRNGIEIQAEEYVTTADGQTFFGCMEIGIEGFARDDMVLTLGIRGSHTQKVPRAICLGSQVIVCSNLCFNGDLASLSTKQTTHAWRRLPGMVDLAVQQLPELAQHENQRADQYKLCQIPEKVGDAVLVDLYRQNVLTGNQLGRAADEWREPSYEEHAQDGHNAWRLMQAVTEVQKPTGATINMDTVRGRTSTATAFMDSFVGVEW